MAARAQAPRPARVHVLLGHPFPVAGHPHGTSRRFPLRTLGDVR